MKQLTGRQDLDRTQAYRLAKAVLNEAERILTSAQFLPRFEKYLRPELPEDEDPTLIVVSTFEQDGLNQYLCLVEPRYTVYLGALMQYLEEDQRDWIDLRDRELEIKRQLPHFSFTVIITTKRRELESVRVMMPYTTDRPITDFVSDDDFLQKMGIEKF